VNKLRVCCISQYDAGGQNYLLAQAMRKYLDWDAVDLTAKQTYLNYPCTWLAEGPERNVEMDTVKEFIETCDFIIMQELPYVPFADVIREKKLPGCVFALGSLARKNLRGLLGLQVKRGLRIAAPISDPTISSYLLGTPFENIMVDLDRLRPLVDGVKKQHDILAITAQTNTTLKGLNVMELVMKDLPDITFLHLKDMAWEDHQRAKAKAHIMIDSIGDESYGLNCLEAMYMDQQVVSNISPWCYALHPDLPIRSIHPTLTKMSIEDGIKYQVENARNQVRNGEADDRKDWVVHHFAPERVVKKWEMYIKWCMED